MSALLGEIVSWDMDKTEVAYQSVRDALTAAGLDPEAARELKPTAAFSRAVKDLKRAGVIDKLERNGDRVCFQYTKRHLESERWQYDDDIVLELDTSTGEIDSVDDPDLADATQQLFAHAVANRNAQDVTRIVQGLFKSHADLFPINRRKGVAYFVPEQHRSFTRQVEQFLGSLGGWLERFPVPSGTEEGNKSVQRAVDAGMQEMVDELNAVVEGWDDTTRESTMTRALERWQAIQAKVDAYQEYLGGEQERLRAELARAKAALVAKMTADEEETAVAA